MTTGAGNQAIAGEVVDPEIVRERRREEGKERLLKNLLSSRYDTLYTRVAAVLNKYIEARNSDQELQLRYWEAYEGYHMGDSVTPEQLKTYTRLTSLTRARAKIQNEFGLFRAEPVVEGYRRDLAGEQRQRATDLKPRSNPLIFVYADESGKTGGEAYLVVGSVWFNDMRAWLAENREQAQQDGVHG